jgi:beta-mannosidase
VYLHNDHPEPWAGELTLRLEDFGGAALEEERAAFQVEPGGLLRFIVPGHWPPAADRLVVADAQGAPCATWFFGRDKDLPYSPPRFELATAPDGQETVVSITAQTLIRDLCLFPERIDPSAVASDQLITLLPGETARLRVAGGRHFTADELSAPGVIWCANAFGALRF